MSRTTFLSIFRERKIDRASPQGGAESKIQNEPNCLMFLEVGAANTSFPRISAISDLGRTGSSLIGGGVPLHNPVIWLSF